jgi:hypothetical protein
LLDILEVMKEITIKSKIFSLNFGLRFYGFVFGDFVSFSFFLLLVLNLNYYF